HRHGTESEGGIETQHEAGKLYLIGLDERPILMKRVRAPQMGHLFCDMKDFTKRTAFLKETVVADFLSREFYGPILTAAARHAQGAAHLADKGGIYLNNLLGDAVSFSGDIVGLLQLAEDIRTALGSYARRLDKEGSLEAGIFVSYGAAPEVATFEDHIFGQIKVSIAEKINESARGTARNGGVRARVDASLAQERARLGRPGLVCPLHVSVSQPLSIG